MARKLVRWAGWLGLCALLNGCTTAMVFLHVQSKINEGEPPPCVKLNSVERAFSPRCGDFVAGSLQAKDVAHSGLPECPLTLAARDSQFWRLLPELLALGAQTQVCQVPPLVALAQSQPAGADCPSFAAASAAEVKAIGELALDDAREVHHDVMRILSCPSAREVGLDSVLNQWRARGQLVPRQLAFSPFGALHPSHLDSPLARKLEATGHQPGMAFQGYGEGVLPGSFEEALRLGEWDGLQWWLARMPELVNGVPPGRGRVLGWLPLARVISPGFMPEVRQRAVLEFLLARGASPWKSLPQSPGVSVVQYARQLHSPWVGVLEQPAHPAAVTAGTP